MPRRPVNSDVSHLEVHSNQPQPMTIQEIEGCLNSAIDALLATDGHLIAVDSSERSISHCLAVHLMHQFPGYSVDCEYNRDGFDVKRLELDERQATDDTTEAVTVFPDIVVHERGISERNLLVVEMKKGSSTVSADYDFKKLRAFRHELNYQFAAHVTLGKCTSGELIRKVVWVGTID